MKKYDEKKLLELVVDLHKHYYDKCLVEGFTPTSLHELLNKCEVRKTRDQAKVPMILRKIK